MGGQGLGLVHKATRLRLPNYDYRRLKSENASQGSF